MEQWTGSSQLMFCEHVFGDLLHVIELPVHRDYFEGLGDEMDRNDLPTECTFLFCGCVIIIIIIIIPSYI